MIKARQDRPQPTINVTDGTPEYSMVCEGDRARQTSQWEVGCGSCRTVNLYCCPEHSRGNQSKQPPPIWIVNTEFLNVLCGLRCMRGFGGCLDTRPKLSIYYSCRLYYKTTTAEELVLKFRLKSIKVVFLFDLLIICCLLPVTFEIRQADHSEACNLKLHLHHCTVH